jgi:predicted DCC family thiol-disulfide oxidoreductase YuxK
MTNPIIVFDTDCVLCSGMVAFVLKYERDRSFRFVGAWSDQGLDLAERHGSSRRDLNTTFLVINGDRVLTKSDAGIEILRHLRRPWCWLAAIRVVPRPVRDAIYSIIARRRYRWFGRREDCTVVPPSERDRFIGVRNEASSGS